MINLHGFDIVVLQELFDLARDVVRELRLPSKTRQSIQFGAQLTRARVYC